jgi:hypothetical protein
VLVLGIPLVVADAVKEGSVDPVGSVEGEPLSDAEPLAECNREMVAVKECSVVVARAEADARADVEDVRELSELSDAASLGVGVCDGV